MTLQERADHYAQVFAKFPASHLRVVREKRQDVLYGTWLIGQDYRNKTKFYGAYPPGYLDRVSALFPDVHQSPLTVLHAFSGSLPVGEYTRCDMKQPAELSCDVRDLNPTAHGSFRLVTADPIYSALDAEKYGVPMTDRGTVTRSLARVTRMSGHLVWLDCVWPMFSKTQWRTVGRIALVRSTNHRVRLVSIFERVSA